MPNEATQAVVALFAAGCAVSAGLVESATEHPTAPGCSFGERSAAACAAMQRAVLLDANGAPLPSELVSCSLPELMAEVNWQLGTEPRRSYSALVRFGAEGPREALRPIALHPIVLEWPEDVPAHEPRSLRLTIPRECSLDSANLATLELHFPGLGEAECVGESRLTGGDPKWCAPTPPGRAVYRLREWHPFTHGIHHAVQASFENDRASIVLDGQEMELADAERLQAKFEKIWEAPSRIEESCRDGSLIVVEGRESDRWKAVLRSCSAIVDFEQVNAELPRSNGYSR